MSEQGEELFDLPVFPLFEQGNTYSGSATIDRKKEIVLRYFLQPNLKEQTLTLSIWQKDVCFELSEHTDTLVPLSEEGLKQVKEILVQALCQMEKEQTEEIDGAI